jgi:hypothetical protein
MIVSSAGSHCERGWWCHHRTWARHVATTMKATADGFPAGWGCAGGAQCGGECRALQSLQMVHPNPLQRLKACGWSACPSTSTEPLRTLHALHMCCQPSSTLLLLSKLIGFAHANTCPYPEPSRIWSHLSSNTPYRPPIWFPLNFYPCTRVALGRLTC